MTELFVLRVNKIEQNYLYIFFHYLNPDKRGGRERTILKIGCPLHTDVTSMRPVYVRNVHCPLRYKQGYRPDKLGGFIG